MKFVQLQLGENGGDEKKNDDRDKKKSYPWFVLLTQLEHYHLTDMLGYTVVGNASNKQIFDKLKLTDQNWLCPESTSRKNNLVFNFLTHPALHTIPSQQQQQQEGEEEEEKEQEGEEEEKEQKSQVEEKEQKSQVEIKKFGFFRITNNIDEKKTEEDLNLFWKALVSKPTDAIKKETAARLIAWFSADSRLKLTNKLTEDGLPDSIRTLLVEYAHYQCLIQHISNQDGQKDGGANSLFNKLHTDNYKTIPPPLPHFPTAPTWPHLLKAQYLGKILLEHRDRKWGQRCTVLAAMLSGGEFYRPGHKPPLRTRAVNLSASSPPTWLVQQVMLAEALVQIALFLIPDESDPTKTTDLHRDPVRFLEVEEETFEYCLGTFLVDMANLTSVTNKIWEKWKDDFNLEVDEPPKSHQHGTNIQAAQQNSHNLVAVLLDHPVTCRLFTFALENSVLLSMSKKPPGYSNCPLDDEGCFLWGDPPNSKWKNNSFDQPWARGHHVSISQKRVLSHGVLRGFWDVITGPYTSNSNQNMRASTLHKEFVHSAFYLAHLMFEMLGPDTYSSDTVFPSRRGRLRIKMEKNETDEVLVQKGWFSEEDNNNTILWCPYRFNTYPIRTIFGTNRLAGFLTTEIDDSHDVLDEDEEDI